MTVIPYGGKGRRRECDSLVNFGETSERKIKLQSIDWANYDCYPSATFFFDSFFSRAASLCQIGFNQIQFSRYNKINSDV